jgi:hypothetical protein
MVLKFVVSGRHIPGHYNKVFRDLRMDLKAKLPPAVIAANLKSVITNKHTRSKEPNKHHHQHPEIGCFEVSVRPYNANKTTIVYSKNSTRNFPKPADVLAKITDMLLPETIRFVDPADADHNNLAVSTTTKNSKPSSSKPTVDVYVVDGYSQRPLVGAEVTLYRLNTSILFGAENLEDLSQMERMGVFRPKNTKSFGAVHDASASTKHVALYRSASFETVDDSCLDVDFDAINTNNNKDQLSGDEKNDDDGNDDRSSVRGRKKKRQQRRSKSPTQFSTTGGLNAQSGAQLVPEYTLRHSVGFAKVRAWSEVDVQKWLTSHGASREVIARAKAVSGVVDGQSLLLHCTAKNLENWGIKTRLHVLKFIRGLAYICAGDNSDLRTKLENVNVNMSFDQYCRQEDKRRPASSSAGLGSFEIVPHTEGVKPNDDGNLVSYIPVATAHTDSRGVLSFSCELTGTYMLKISHPYNRDMYSHAFQITNTIANYSMKYNMSSPKSPNPQHSQSYRIIHSVCLKPKLSLFMCVIRFSNIDELDAFPYYAFLTAVLNTKSGRRHVVYTEYWSKEYIDNEYVFVGECWLPIGRYVCGVTGEQFILTDTPSKEMNRQWKDLLPEYYEQYPVEKAGFRMYKASHAMRLHRNLIHRAYHRFHKIIRRLRARRNLNHVRTQVSAFRKMRKYFDYIRQKLKNRAATNIQRVVRGGQARRRYRQLKNKMISLQAMWRGYNTRVNVLSRGEMTGVMFFINAVIGHRRSSAAKIKLRRLSRDKIGNKRGLIIDAIRSKRFQAAVIIQCAFRLYLNRKQLNRVIRMKRAKRTLRQKFLVLHRQKREKMREQQRIRYVKPTSS